MNAKKYGQSVVILVLLLLIAVNILAVPAQCSGDYKIKALFIGNSHTYVNGGLPQLLMRLDPTIYANMVVIGGATLKQLWDDGKAQQAIADKRFGWNYVILQENGRGPMGNAVVMRTYAIAFDKEIRKSGAKTILFMTQGYSEVFFRNNGYNNAQAPAADMLTINQQVYENIGQEIGAQVAPVALAWDKCKAYDLYSPDGYHANPRGTYLTACVFYTVLTGKSPIGLATYNLQKETEIQNKVWAVVKNYPYAFRH